MTSPQHYERQIRRGEKEAAHKLELEKEEWTVARRNRRVCSPGPKWVVKVGLRTLSCCSCPSPPFSGVAGYARHPQPVHYWFLVFKLSDDSGGICLFSMGLNEIGALSKTTTSFICCRVSEGLVMLEMA